MRLEAAGEAGLIAYLGEDASPETTARVQALAEALRPAQGDWLVDLVPAYASLLVLFDPLRTDHLAVTRTLHAAGAALPAAGAILPTGRQIELPVYYDAPETPDLARMSAHCGLPAAEIIERHCAQAYRVCAIGFAPGFAYLAEVDAALATPRLESPRKRVPRGAVAVADRQTAVYPAESPGGWNLIGLCPVRLFDPSATPPMPVQVGDQVRFRPITAAEYQRWPAQA